MLLMLVLLVIYHTNKRHHTFEASIPKMRNKTYLEVIIKQQKSIIRMFVYLQEELYSFNVRQTSTFRSSILIDNNSIVPM